jgi:tRNA (guanine37-N1)-methyltransferase
MNLIDEYLPYKHVIGQVILDVGDFPLHVSPDVEETQKNKTVRTVVNKLDTIDSQFRVFKMELLAGEPDFVVEHVCVEVRWLLLLMTTLLA